MPITFPPLVTSGQVVAAAHTNMMRAALVAVYSEVFAPQSNVDYGGRNLSNLGVVTFEANGYFGSNVAFGGAIPQAAIDLKVGRQIQFNRPDNGNQFRLGFTENDLSLRLSFNGTNVAVFGSDGTFYPPHIELSNATGARHIRLATPSPLEIYDIYRDGATGVLRFDALQSSFRGYSWRLQGSEKVAIDSVGVLRILAGIRAASLAQHASNAAALTGGLVAGDFYLVTGSNPRQIACVF